MKGSGDTNLSTTEYVLGQKLNLKRQIRKPTQDWARVRKENENRQAVHVPT